MRHTHECRLVQSLATSIIGYQPGPNTPSCTANTISAFPLDFPILPSLNQPIQHLVYDSKSSGWELSSTSTLQAASQILGAVAHFRYSTGTMEAIGLTASLIAILELCGKTILYIQTAKGGSKQKTQLVTEIQSLQLVIGQLRDVSDNDGWKKTMKILAEPGAPLKLLEETLRSLVQKLGPNAGLRCGLDLALWPFQEKEVNSILAMIERQKASLSLALENNSRLLQDRIASQVDSNRDSLEELKTICGGLHEEINTVKRSLEQSRARETLQWMTKLNFGPRHDTILQSWDRKTGTGTWILRHPLFVEWTAGKTAATKLWCHGIPGAGKSVIAAIIFDHLREDLRLSNQNISVATVYCDHEQQADQNLDELERSILHQALADCATIPAALQDLREETKDGFSPSLFKLHSVIASSPAASQTLFVVLDALDEASEIVQDQLVGRISALPFRDVRILCTSRTWPKFEEAFEDSPQIQVSASDNDVERFVRKKIEDVSRLRKVMGESTAMIDKVVTKVLEKAKGSFLMAKHHMDELSSANTRKQLLQKLESLPDKMQEAYDLAMKRIRQQAEPDKTLAERTLSLIFGSQRQLTASEIQHALATLTLYKDDEDDESDGVEEDNLPSAGIIIQCCQGLLVLERDSHYFMEKSFRTSHYTVNEYFRQNFTGCFPDGHELLAMACCYYLSQPSLQVVGNHTSYSHSDAINDLFLDYASNYWAVHVLEARRRSPLMNQTEGAMERWWTNLEEVTRLTSFSGKTILKIQKHFHIIRQVKQRSWDVNAVDDKGECLLHNLLADADLLAARFLLELPSLEINPMSSSFHRMLELAIKNHWIDVTQHLIKIMAPDKRLLRDRDGALSERLRNVQNDVIADCHSGPIHIYFLEAVIGTLQHLDSQHDRALLLDLISAFVCLFDGHREILRFFLGNDLNLEATDADGNNILHMAAKLGLVDVTGFLLQQNLNPSVVNTQGKSPCQMAIDNDNFCLFLHLLPAMSVSARCLLSETRQAAIENSHIGRPRDDGYTILLSEAQTGRFGSAVDAENRTALFWVVGGGVSDSYQQQKSISQLLRLGTDVDWRDDEGITALSHHISSSCDHLTASELLEAGANPNARDCKGMTPILYAVSSCPKNTKYQLCMVEVLLRKGANVGDKDCAGVSAAGHLIHSGGYADDDALEAAQALAKQCAGVELTPRFPYIADDLKHSMWAEEEFKYTLGILWILLGNEALDWKSFFGPKTERMSGYKATIRLIELVKSEKDALEERYQSDNPLEWLGRTQIDRRIKEEIDELLTLAGIDR